MPASTTANPNLLKRFLEEPDVVKEDLPESWPLLPKYYRLSQ
jgi:hypothetical protein